MEERGEDPPTVWQRRKLPNQQRFCETFNWEVAGRQIHVAQLRPFNAKTCGLAVWDSSLVLSKYLERRFGTSGLQGKRLIELGSGCGVLGISAGLLGGEVILTDAKVALTQLSQNVELNLPPLEFPNVHVCQLKWGEDVSAALHPHAVPFDFVLASDVVYNEDTVDALLQSFYDLSDAHTEILLGLQTHNKESIEYFFQTVGKLFHYQKVKIIFVYNLFFFFSQY
jgi:predicted nicotinamide N-methyase